MAMCPSCCWVADGASTTAVAPAEELTPGENLDLVAPVDRVRRGSYAAADAADRQQHQLGGCVATPVHDRAA